MQKGKRPELDPRYHEAAYDAYITGVAFARIVKYEEIKSKQAFLNQYNSVCEVELSIVDMLDNLKNMPIDFNHDFIAKS